ncbi:hypothetical protein CKAH01_03370 [Colletotrichum kahawae]|uniref:Uncharacterized protein n=1 Tax=Colletotrichum kahawae TaxID=34407 RepID=A0AAD9YTY6_COLKA|nr:hypothetical protein CKAH01_03370 [Colletotrichum kahawae]
MLRSHDRPHRAIWSVPASWTPGLEPHIRTGTRKRILGPGTTVPSALTLSTLEGHLSGLASLWTDAANPQARNDVDVVQTLASRGIVSPRSNAAIDFEAVRGYVARDSPRT